MKAVKIFVSFNIHGSKIDPDEITVRTGITPSRTWRQGDPGIGPGGRRLRHAWKVESRLTTADTIDDHIDDILEQIGGDASKLRDIEDGERMLSIAIYMVDSHAPPCQISERAVQVFASLRAVIDVDLYPWTSS